MTWQVLLWLRLNFVPSSPSLVPDDVAGAALAAPEPRAGPPLTPLPLDVTRGRCCSGCASTSSACATRVRSTHRRFWRSNRTWTRWSMRTIPRTTPHRTPPSHAVPCPVPTDGMAGSHTALPPTPSSVLSPLSAWHATAHTVPPPSHAIQCPFPAERVACHCKHSALPPTALPPTPSSV
jgi:hypothetical protein